MSAKRFKIKKCTLLPSEGSSLKENYDLVRGNPIIDYYESLECPSISMTITFVDIDQVISRLGITGGEFIDLTVLIDGFENDFKITEKKQKFMLNSVREMVTETKTQIATLEFVSVESIINETAKVNKKYTGNVSQTIDELLKGKKGIQTTKNIDKDEAANSYSFVGNLKRPFDTIQWLCPKTQSSKKSFGFLFYEDLDGYHFRSIEKLLEQKPEFTYTLTTKPFDSEVRGFNIMHNKLNQSNDIGINCRLGMYANRTLYVDIENQTLEEVDFKITDLKLKKPVTLLKGIENSPTRLMLRVNDFGVAQKGSKKDDVQPESELAVYQNKSYIRNTLLFSQSMQISVPINPDLRVGQTMFLKFPLKKGTDKDMRKETASYGTEKDNDPSGKYLVSELRHLIGGKQSETQLTLIRDMFTA